MLNLLRQLIYRHAENNVRIHKVPDSVADPDPYNFQGSGSVPGCSRQCCGSEIIFFFGSGSYLDLNFGSGFGSGSGLFMKITLEIQII